MSLKIKFATCILLFFACFSYAEDNASKSSYKQHIKELVEKYPIKPHHAKLYFDCMHCHTNQILRNLKTQEIRAVYLVIKAKSIWRKEPNLWIL
ncbi:Uncharacterised protein [Campylobacter sputorum subsp. bubulus]|uniref:Cytochrome C n=1 Tax=Campylobacter sputorum subsp. sputorum TaxID=32024 RepID=A0A381DJ39_9BACT|nr:Uncharacterised protein [Campylobacter sputorum subsp. bubulus]SUX10501.1 Uncharacterised protein [Campylobacter sputorum subsp. sputorum]